MKKAAIIGLGDISQIHIAAILANPHIKLCGACDIEPEARKGLPEGTPFFSDYKEMVRAVKPDCVHICLPHYLHYPVARELAEAGCNIFCEKPVALNVKQAEEFVELEARYPQLHMGICLQNRLNESVEVLKELIDSGAYGKIVGLRGLVPWYREKGYFDVKPWRGQMETAGGGCMINQSVHTLDLLYFLGGDIKGLHASVSQLLNYGIEVEDTVTARLDFKNGARGLFFATIANYKNESVQIGVQMEKGEFLIRENRLYQVLEDDTQKLLIEDDKMPGSKFYYGASHGKLIAHFYECLETGEHNYIKVRDAKMSIQLIDTIIKSGRTGEYQAVSSSRFVCAGNEE